MALGVSIARWFRHSAKGRAISSWLAAQYIGLVARTTRWETHGWEQIDALIDQEERGIIAAIWHGRLFMSATYAPIERRKSIAVVSNNSDGQLICDIVAHWGIVAVRGSTYDKQKRRDKGGAKVYEFARRGLLDDKAAVAITPDGPRGPRMRAQPGTAHLAIDTHCCIVPIAFSVRRGKLLRNWDRFLVPSPFNRGAIVYGDPIRPPVDPTPEEERAFHFAVETALTDVTNRADDLCGRDRVPPGAPIETL
ncbi:MAG: lysophospholipid acyltransferase family protein [Pseudomonadota bacterium]